MPIEYTNDQHCDDGGDGSSFSACPYGTDCTDCGERVATAQYECERVEATEPPAPPPQGTFMEQTCARLAHNFGHRYGVVAESCFFSNYDLSNHNDDTITTRLRADHMCILLPFAPPPPPPELYWTTYAVVTVLTAAITNDASVPEGALREAVETAVHAVAPDALVRLVATEALANGRRLEGGNASEYDDAYYGYADERPDEAAAEGGRRLQTPAPPPSYHKVLDGCASDANPPWLPHHNNDAVWKHFDTRSETLAVVPMRTCDSGGTYPPSSEGGVPRTFGCEQAYDQWPSAAPTGGITQTIYHSSNADTVTYCDSNTKGPNGENWAAFYFGEAVDLALVEVINRGEGLGARLSEHEVWYCTNGATVEADCNWVRCSNYGGATTDLQVIEHTCEAQGATAFKLSKPCGVDQFSNNFLSVQEAKAFRPLYPAELKPHFSLTQHATTNCGGASAGTLVGLTFPDGDSVKVLGDYVRCAYACMAIPGCNGFVFADLTGDATEGKCYPRTLASPFDPSICSTDSLVSTYEMVRDGTDEAVCVPDDGALAGVRCCSADGSSAISVCDADACFPKWGRASSPLPASSIACPAHATFAEAEAECAAQNLRLCTAQELYYPGCLTGCGYDSLRIWTSEGCSPPPPPYPPDEAPLPPPSPPPDPFLVVNTYACASPHCNVAACDTNPKTRLAYQIAIVASTGMDAAQRAQVLSAIESALEELKDALGFDALCGVGDSGAFTEQFVDFTPSPPPNPSPPSPPPATPPPLSPPPPPARDAAVALFPHLHRLGRHGRLLRPARAAREQRNLCALTPQTSAPQYTARAHAAPRATPTVRRRGRRRGQRLERVRVWVCENASRTTHAHAKPKKLTRVFASARAQKKAPTTATARTAATRAATGTPSRARTWCRCRWATG